MYYGNQYPQNPYGQTPAQNKKKWGMGDYVAKVFVPILVALIGLIGTLYVAGVFTPKPATPAIPVLTSSYNGTMIRDNDGVTLDFSLKQVNENSSGSFTASASINGCPAEVTDGTVKASGAIAFTATESTICQDQGLIGTFTGNVHSDGSMSGRWSTNNGSIQIVGSWNLQ